MASIRGRMVGWWCAWWIAAALVAGPVALASDAEPYHKVMPDDRVSFRADNFSHTNCFGWLESDITLTAGMRNDSLRWSIAGSSAGGPPNVLSELSWSDLKSHQLSLTHRGHIRKHIYVRAAGNYAWVDNGRVRDSDYGLDSRTAEWSRSVSDSRGDELWDLSIGSGYSFYFREDRLSISPLVGYSYHKQNLRITNGRQVISQDNPFSSDPAKNPPPVGPLSCQLNSTYSARWEGPWIGCDVRYELPRRFFRLPQMALAMAAEYHWADFCGTGNWNLRGDLAHPKSFKQSARGSGLHLAAACVMQMSSHWDLSLNVTHQAWTTASGTDRKFLQNGGRTETRLNEVVWENTSFMIGAVYRF